MERQAEKNSSAAKHAFLLARRKMAGKVSARAVARVRQLVHT